MEGDAASNQFQLRGSRHVILAHGSSFSSRVVCFVDAALPPPARRGGKPLRRPGLCRRRRFIRGRALIQGAANGSA